VPNSRRSRRACREFALEGPPAPVSAQVGSPPGSFTHRRLDRTKPCGPRALCYVPPRRLPTPRPQAPATHAQPWLADLATPVNAFFRAPQDNGHEQPPAALLDLLPKFARRVDENGSPWHPDPTAQALACSSPDHRSNACRRQHPNLVRPRRNDLNSTTTSPGLRPLAR